MVNVTHLKKRKTRKANLRGDKEERESERVKEIEVA